MENGVHAKLRPTFATQLVHFEYHVDVLFGSLVVLVKTWADMIVELAVFIP